MIQNNCGGNFFHKTACGQCDMCTTNLMKIGDTLNHMLHRFNPDERKQFLNNIKNGFCECGEEKPCHCWNDE